MEPCNLIKNNDVYVIMRSVGERTETQCIRLLNEIFGERNVFLLKGITPFSTMLDKAYEIGFITSKKYTLMIDADVLLDKERIYRFLNAAEMVQNDEGPFFSIEAFVYDRFREKPVLAGNNLYLTQYLNDARKYINKNSLRPETTTMRGIAEYSGIQSIYLCDIIGIHDFFQDYKSIFKKGIVFSKKHSNIKEWAMNSKQISDEKRYLVEGIKKGNDLGEIEINDLFLEDVAKESGVSFELQGELLEQDVENALKTFRNKFVYYTWTVSETKESKQIIKDALLQFKMFNKLKILKDSIFHRSKLIVAVNKNEEKNK